MPDPTHALTLQLLEWISDRPRRHADVIDAWRSTCPRLSIWEDACIAGLIDSGDGPDPVIMVSAKGEQLRRAAAAAADASAAPAPAQAQGRLSIATGSIGSAGVNPKIFA